MYKVISGGQTGADQAALRAAKIVNMDYPINTGGTAAKDFMTTRGPNLSLKTSYGLEELQVPSDIIQNLVSRSKLNVDNSDVTVAFLTKRGSGTDKTCGYAIYGRWQSLPLSDVRRFDHGVKPLLIISDLRNPEQAALEIIDFVKVHNAKILNICGHRDDDTAGFANYSQVVEDIMVLCLRELCK